MIRKLTNPDRDNLVATGFIVGGVIVGAMLIWAVDLRCKLARVEGQMEGAFIRIERLEKERNRQ